MKMIYWKSRLISLRNFLSTILNRKKPAYKIKLMYLINLTLWSCLFAFSIFLVILSCFVSNYLFTDVLTFFIMIYLPISLNFTGKHQRVTKIYKIYRVKIDESIILKEKKIQEIYCLFVKFYNTD